MVGFVIFDFVIVFVFEMIWFVVERCDYGVLWIGCGLGVGGWVSLICVMFLGWSDVDIDVVEVMYCGWD